MRNELLQISARIKELREILEINPVVVAQKLNCSLDKYSSYENGEADIPISVLYELAAILDVDFTVLLTGDSPRMVTHTITRKGEGLAVERYPGYDFSNLAYNFVGREMEPMLVTLSSENEPAALVTHSGQEFNYVLSGSIKVVLRDKEHILNEGDSIYFDPKIPHGQQAVDGDATFMTIIKE